MAYAVCKVPVAPLRAEPAHKSEMISQLLFSEAALVLEETKDFIKVQGVYDGYEGWCQRSQLALIDNWTNTPAQTFTAAWINDITINNIPAKVPLGIPVWNGVNWQQLAAVLPIDYKEAVTWHAVGANKNPPRLNRQCPFHKYFRFCSYKSPFVQGMQTCFALSLATIGVWTGEILSACCCCH